MFADLFRLKTVEISQEELQVGPAPGPTEAGWRVVSPESDEQ